MLARPSFKLAGDILNSTSCFSPRLRNSIATCPGSTFHPAGTSKCKFPLAALDELLETPTFTRNSPSWSVGITCCPGSSMTENTGTIASFLFCSTPLSSTKGADTGDEISLFGPSDPPNLCSPPKKFRSCVELWVWYSTVAWKGGGGKGNVRYRSSSILLMLSVSGSSRCQ